MNWGAFDRHLRNLGFVPPEFREAQRIYEDPDALGYTLRRERGVKAMAPDQLLEACFNVLPDYEAAEITQAALLCHSGHPNEAERHREFGGYGGLQSYPYPT